MHQPTDFISQQFQDLQDAIREPLLVNSPTVCSIPDNLSRSTILSFEGLHKHWMSNRQQHVFMCLVFFAIGFSGITALAITIFGLLSLDIAAYILVWPSLVVWCVLAILYPDYGGLALRGFVVGLLACLFYDCMRFTTIALGLWGDFIPRISMWLLHSNKPDWIVGYIWRYVGDGGLMSTAFVVGYCLLKPRLDVRLAALAFGIAIWLCLIGTILLAPHGSQMLFQLTPITVSLSLLGHIIYGLSIGFLYPIFIPQGALAKLFRLLHTWYTGNMTEVNAYLREENQVLREQLRIASGRMEESSKIVQLDTKKQPNDKRKVARSIKRRRRKR